MACICGDRSRRRAIGPGCVRLLHRAWRGAGTLNWHAMLESLHSRDEKHLHRGMHIGWPQILIATAALACGGEAAALGFGPIRSSVVLGQPLNLAVPVIWPKARRSAPSAPAPRSVAGGHQLPPVNVRVRVTQGATPTESVLRVSATPRGRGTGADGNPQRRLPDASQPHSGAAGRPAAGDRRRRASRTRCLWHWHRRPRRRWLRLKPAAKPVRPRAARPTPPNRAARASRAEPARAAIAASAPAASARAASRGGATACCAARRTQVAAEARRRPSQLRQAAVSAAQEQASAARATAMAAEAAASAASARMRAMEGDIARMRLTPGPKPMRCCNCASNWRWTAPSATSRRR